jgi:hypothetical protein
MPLEPENVALRAFATPNRAKTHTEFKIAILHVLFITVRAHRSLFACYTPPSFFHCATLEVCLLPPPETRHRRRRLVLSRLAIQYEWQCSVILGLYWFFSSRTRAVVGDGGVLLWGSRHVRGAPLGHHEGQSAARSQRHEQQ